MVQQSVTGGGTFDGTAYGRALGRFPGPGGAAAANVVRISSRLMGALSNAYKLTLYDLGAGTNVPVTTAQLVGAQVLVTLRRTIMDGVLATAQEVASAINAAQLPVVASYELTGNGVVAPMVGTFIDNLTSGADAALRGPNANQFIWSLPSGDDGGLFYFENREDLIVPQFEALFSGFGAGAETVTISRENLDSNLEPISGESVPVFVWSSLTSVRPDIAFTGENIILHPYQALSVVVTGGLSGVVRFDARRAA